RRDAAPTLLAAQAAAPVRRPAFYVYVLLALLLLGAGIVIGWLRPWQAPPVKPEAIVVKPPIESLPGEPAPAAVATQPRSEPLMPGPMPAQAPKASMTQTPPPSKPSPMVADPAPGPSAAPPQPQRAARALPAVKGRPRTEEAGAPGSGPPPSTAKAAIEAQPAKLADLPLSLRAELPPMKFTVHAYSADPERRLVGIDSRILREGDTVAPGLKLEQITPEGMIFDYKGYRFQRGVK
ncbi:MAG: general secretion pathway protein GspB, partial [Betaproteobacteria bacterium]